MASSQGLLPRRQVLGMAKCQFQWGRVGRKPWNLGVFDWETEVDSYHDNIKTRIVEQKKMRFCWQKYGEKKGFGQEKIV